jgi:hypothetical protein
LKLILCKWKEREKVFFEHHFSKLQRTQLAFIEGEQRIIIPLGVTIFDNTQIACCKSLRKVLLVILDCFGLIENRVTSGLHFWSIILLKLLLLRLMF